MIKDLTGAVQLGASVTPANNIVFDASAHNGSATIYKGDQGTPVTTIATIDATGINSPSNAGLATVTNSATPSIWTAAGFTIDLDNTGAVTTTGLVTGMTSVQIGSSKRIIVRAGQTWTVTASANLVIDGNTSGNNTFPAGSILEVIALSLTAVVFRTVQANGTWTPTVSAQAGTYTSASATAEWAEFGKTYIINFILTITTNGTAATGAILSLPSGVTASHASYGMGRETASTGNALCCRIASGGAQIIIQKYDGTYIGANGYVLEGTITLTKA